MENLIGLASNLMAINMETLEKSGKFMRWRADEENVMNIDEDVCCVLRCATNEEGKIKVEANEPKFQ
jgi:hypothetical protein